MIINACIITAFTQKALHSCNFDLRLKKMRRISYLTVLRICFYFKFYSFSL